MNLLNCVILKQHIAYLLGIAECNESYCYHLSRSRMVIFSSSQILFFALGILLEMRLLNPYTLGLQLFVSDFLAVLINILVLDAGFQNGVRYSAILRRNLSQGIILPLTGYRTGKILSSFSSHSIICHRHFEPTPTSGGGKISF